MTAEECNSAMYEKTSWLNCVYMKFQTDFFAYCPVKRLKELVALAKEENPLYNFISEDGIRHRVWKSGSGEGT